MSNFHNTCNVHCICKHLLQGCRGCYTNDMFYVYVLLSLKDHNFYIGYTTNVSQRFAEHKSGEVPSTKNRQPLQLIFFEGYTNTADALRGERYFKSTSGKRALRLMLQATLKERLIPTK